MATEAQKRANKKYRDKQKQWQVRLSPELYEKIESERQRRNLTRKELLELLIK